MKRISHFKFKKSLIFAVFAIFISLSFQTKADTSGDWEYKIMDSSDPYPDEIMLQKYTGSDESVTIPNYITTGYTGGVIPINRAVRVLQFINPVNSVKNLTVPSQVKIITELDFPNLTSLTLNEGLEEADISRVSKLEILHIPASVTQLAPLGSKVRLISCASGSPFLVSGGVLYEDHSMSTLHTYPRSGGISTFTIPTSVTRIRELAFKNNDDLDKVYLNHNNITIDGSQYFSADWLFTGTQINFNPDYLNPDPYHYTGKLYAPAQTPVSSTAGYSSSFYGGPYVKTSTTSLDLSVGHKKIWGLEDVFDCSYMGRLTYTVQKQSGVKWLDVGEISALSDVWSFTPTESNKPTLIRFKATDGYHTATLNCRINYPNLTGTVELSGDFAYDETITASMVSSNANGTVTYTWKRNGEYMPLSQDVAQIKTGTTYTLSKEDIGSVISVEATDSYFPGSKMSAEYGPVEKAEYSDPMTAQISAIIINETNITVLPTEEGVEVGATNTSGTANDVSYQGKSSFKLTTFNNDEPIQPNTTYRIYYRYYEDKTTKPSPEIGYIEVTTAEEGTSIKGTVTLTTDCNDAATVVATVDITSSSAENDLTYTWKTINGTDVNQTYTYNGIHNLSITPNNQLGNCYLEVRSSTEGGALTSELYEFYQIPWVGSAPEEAPEMTSEELGCIYLNNNSYQFQLHIRENNTPPCSFDTWEHFNVNSFDDLTPGSTVWIFRRYAKQYAGTGNTFYAPSASSPGLEYTVPYATLTLTVQSEDVNDNISMLANTIVNINGINYTTNANGEVEINNLLEGMFDFTLQTANHDDLTSQKNIVSLSQEYTVTLTEQQKLALTGTVTISGTLQFDEELTTNVSNDNNSGTLGYQWKRDGVNISGATSETYTLVEADIATAISIEVTSSVETGSISSTGTTAIEKADKAAPAAPTLDSKTHNSITLVAVNGCEYSIDGGTWQTSVEFAGLTAETEYALTQRYAETNTHNASPASNSITVTTNKEASNVPTSIKETEQAFTVYPNPVSNYLTIEGLQLASPIKIYNVSGQVVLQHTATSTVETLDLQSLANGMYFIETANKNIKIIKQ